jgi:ComF family protein
MAVPPEDRNVPFFVEEVLLHLLPAPRDLPVTPLRRIADGVLNLFYPASCILCAVPVARFQDRGVCQICWQKLLRLRIAGASCPSCGLPYRTFDDQAAHLCGKCVIQLPAYSGARAFGCYSAELSRLVQALKFEGRQDMACLLSPLLASTFLEYWSPADMDFVVPIPLHPRRRRERGYNQAALLASALARILGLTFLDDALVRKKATLPQVGLSDSDRMQNVRGAFHCARPEKTKGKRILLVDDVMTTGSTVASAAAVLLEAGALRVSVLVLARAVAGWE